ncbi:polysaccharide deacetylase family protein [Gudongella sp. DL1XJH-153]|uniref:polysaccharide deacetylase family protein n=1 Tax=Gudongella sp. DL1XJH-153 TaxID=3409804 RepID=UPI003BB6E710
MKRYQKDLGHYRNEWIIMIKKAIILLMITTLMAGCSQAETSDFEQDDPVEQVKAEVVEAEEETTEGQEEEPVDPKEEIDLSLKPNESGRIMVLMYHNIGEEEKEWTRTPENFNRDLKTLYDKGYRPISLKDYATGNITTSQGYTPIVITFDDGNKNNFEYLEDGTINGNSAVGLLTDFHKENPDFSPAATFFLTGDVPFGQRDSIGKKFNFLIENGMDIGNHSKNHANFTEASAELLQKEIGEQSQYLESFVEVHDYRVNTIALPYGIRPKDESKIKYLQEGIYEDVLYENIAILNVGWNPGYSPYDNRFNFESIPRIRASEMKVDNVGMYNYLEYFDNNPDERFISDGNPDIITIPEGKQELIKSFENKEIYIYDKK